MCADCIGATPNFNTHRATCQATLDALLAEQTPDRRHIAVVSCLAIAFSIWQPINHLALPTTWLC